MTSTTQRLDKWLWCARFFKTRTLATKVCQGGTVRLNGKSGVKPHAAVHAGDVLAFPQGPHVRAIEIVSLAERRGPAPEAQALYNDLSPPQTKRPDDRPEAPRAPSREKGAGRPTKRDRRAMDRLRPDPGSDSGSS